MPFEQAPGLDLDVDHFEVGVYEGMPGPGAFNKPATIIRTTQAWSIVVDWDEIGLFCGILPGNWRVEAYLESMGPGTDFNIGEALDPIACGHHQVTIPVVAGNPALAPGEFQTPFKLVVTLTAEWPGGVARYPMAGYLEGPILQFYQTP
jgi:hypothetical protein